MKTWTEIVTPSFGSVELWRGVVKNNQPIGFVSFVIVTNETWLPKILVDAGFFKSGSQIKKNKPEFWRDVQDFEIVMFGNWAEVLIIQF